MTRASVTQTRTWTYDPVTLRLASVTQPETGTISYTWNADGTLQKKSDTRGSGEFTYDSLKRVTKKTPKMGTTVESANVVNYYYDSYSGSGTYTQNGTGRLVAV